MGNVSRPLIALLAGTVAFFVLWLVALKPGSSTNSGSPAVGKYQPAVDQARKALGVVNAASAAHGGTVPTSPSPTTTTPSSRTNPAAGTASASAAVSAKTAARSGPSTNSTPSQRLGVVARALSAHKVLALLFYNPAAADDRQLTRELQSVPSSGGRVVKLEVPLSELASYSVVTQQVPVNVSPTLVLVDTTRHASTIVGFADRFEIAQRVSDAVAS